MRYTVLLYKDPEEDQFGVLVPELPGCTSVGTSVEDALLNVREAIEGHLLVLAQSGEEIPEEDTPPIVATVDVHPDFSSVMHTGAATR